MPLLSLKKNVMHPFYKTKQNKTKKSNKKQITDFCNVVLKQINT